VPLLLLQHTLCDPSVSETLCAHSNSSSLTMLRLPGESRGYGAWMPPFACARNPLPRSTPVILSLGCFGCAIETVGAAAIRIGRQIGFMVLAGEQVQRSWNAGECCGVALQQGSPDTAYLSTLVRHAAATIPAMHSAAIFAFGWSNGGYMGTTLAHETSWLAGVVAVSGYTYKYLQPIRGGSRTPPIGGGVQPLGGGNSASSQRPPGGLPSEALNASLPKPTPVLFIHARDDPIVHADGCCLASRCCCGIGATSERCVGVLGAWRAWAVANRCAAQSQMVGTGAAPGSGVGSNASPHAGLITDARIVLTRASRESSARTTPLLCARGTRCAAQTVACVSASGGHFTSRARFAEGGFPYTDEVGGWLARQACALGGSWEPRANVCTCARMSTRLQPATAMDSQRLDLEPVGPPKLALGAAFRAGEFCLPH
jgi:poly(3-hydroxybutyrate) depolymerase